MYSFNNNQNTKIVYNEAYVALIECDLQSISMRFKNPIVYDYDDLDYFEAIDFELADGFKFMLFRYKGMPNDKVAIYFQSRLLNWRNRLSEVIGYLNITENSILEVNDNYFNIP